MLKCHQTVLPTIRYTRRCDNLIRESSPKKVKTHLFELVLDYGEMTRAILCPHKCKCTRTSISPSSCRTHYKTDCLITKRCRKSNQCQQWRTVHRYQVRPGETHHNNNFLHADQYPSSAKFNQWIVISEEWPLVLLVWWCAWATERLTFSNCQQLHVQNI